MAHAVSATFTRFERMSPPAAIGALLLHVLVAFLLWWSSPLHHDDDAEEKAVEVTMEAPPPPPPEPKPAPETPKPPPPAPAAKPQPAPPPTMRGLAPAAPLGEKTQGAGKPSETAPEAKPVEKVEEPTPEKAEAPQQALAPPPAPTPPPLEKELPPVEVPSAPVTSRDIPRPAPPPPEPKPEPKPQPKPPQQTPPPPAPQTGIAPSPLSRLPPRGAPPPSTRRDPGPPPSPFVNPADARALNDAADYYLQQVNYKISLQIFAPSSQDELRLVVGVRFTIARDGRLLDVSVARPSGSPAHDGRIIAAFRAASPFPPLPAALPGDSMTFTLPIGTRQAR